MGYTLQIPNLADAVRTLGATVSLASVMLTPSGGMQLSPNSPNQVPVAIHAELVTTIPDGQFDPSAMYYRTLHGLGAGSVEFVIMAPTLIDSEDDLSDAEIASALQNASGLPVKTLARLAGVSRTTYHEWMKGGGISKEHRAQLDDLLETFRILRDIRSNGLPDFLLSESPSGTMLDLLTAGDVSAVIGFSLRPPLPNVAVSPVSQEAREISGLPGWLADAPPLAFDIPVMSDAELDSALDDLSPQPASAISSSKFASEETDEGDAGWAQGFYLE